LRRFSKGLITSICIKLLIKENLKIVKDQNFPGNVKEAIRKGFEAAEREFLMNHALNKLGDVADRSGSCAVVAMIVGNS
jgi:protein phosphatase 2C family protein 2/3